MKSIVIALHDQAIELRFPDDLQPQIELLFGAQPPADDQPRRKLSVRQIGPGRYSIGGDTGRRSSNLTIPELLDALLEGVVGSLIDNLETGVALHAASIGWGSDAIVIAGPTGSGKTSLAGCLVASGFEFLSDELTLLPEASGAILSFPRPLLAKFNSNDLIGHMTRDGSRQAVQTAANVLICSKDRRSVRPQSREPALIAFPRFTAGAALEVTGLAPAMACLKLMECNLNARNFSDHGLRMLTEFACNVPAIAIKYGSYQQLHRVADRLAKFSGRPVDLPELVAAFAPEQAGPEGEKAIDASAAPPVAPAEPAAAPDVIALEQTTASNQAAVSQQVIEGRKLTIGMATYDDYDGVYFTLQAIRMYHPEILDDVEFLVIDNNPAGPCAEGLKNLKTWIPNYRYVPNTTVSGTAIRDAVFGEARGEFVLCIDCHILVVPGALRRLLEYFAAHPDTHDLLQGPLIYDDLKSYSTHFNPVWEAGMYGTWECDPAGADADQPPFEILMQGLGLFACRRSAWPGFNPAFRGFGGEEGYIHEKFRQRGGKALCLPFLRWMHRFNRPLGIPYTNIWEDRVRNYLIGFRELGWETDQIIEHFRMLLGDRVWAQVVEQLGPDVQPLVRRYEDCVSAAASHLRPAQPKHLAWSDADPRSWLKSSSLQFGAKTP